MIVNAQGTRLAFLRPAVTTDGLLMFTAALATEVTRLLVCNTTGGALTFRFYHVDALAAFGPDYALYYDKSVAANDTFDSGAMSPNAGFTMKEADFIAVKVSAAGLAFQLYGVTASIAPGMN